MTDTTSTVSPLAEELLNAGAVAEQPDYVKMLAEQNRLMNAALDRIRALEAERGIPSDPIDGAVKNLLAHVKARAAQYPVIDFAEIEKVLAELPADSADLTPVHSGLVMTMVHEFTDVLKHAELGYVRELSTLLHKEVLKSATAVPDLAPLVNNLSAELASIQSQLEALRARTTVLETPPAVPTAPVVPAVPAIPVV